MTTHQLPCAGRHPSAIAFEIIGPVKLGLGMLTICGIETTSRPCFTLI
jgi:hypothetical protein